MSISDKIKKSKEEIKYSQKLNVSCDIYNLIWDLESRKNDREFQMTIPINIVASNESFFKETISSLIDFDEKYLNNSKALIKRNNIKIDIEDKYLQKLKFKTIWNYFRSILGIFESIFYDDFIIYFITRPSIS